MPGKEKSLTKDGNQSNTRTAFISPQVKTSGYENTKPALRVLDVLQPGVSTRYIAGGKS
jgi:hypothetical protein